MQIKAVSGVAICSAGYAASDMVQANPIVSTFWGILFFRVSVLYQHHGTLVHEAGMSCTVLQHASPSNMCGP